ncbi:MAG: SGNH/GDSL hydrolase family protein [Patescibacteria group bacterium]
MKRTIAPGHFYFIFISLFLISAGLYLNWAYSHIYDGIQDAGLKQVKELVTYNFNFKNNNEVRGSLFKYVVLGDSLTYGVGTNNYNESYPYLVAGNIAQKNNNQALTLYNYSWPGDKSSDLVEKFLDYAVSEQPTVITILIGVNDIHNQVPASVFRANYDLILYRLTSETNAKIYLISIPYIGSSKLILPPYNFYFNYKTKQFNKIIKDLASKYKVEYIDLYSPTVNLFKKSGDHYAPDSFHPSASGYALWGQIIYDRINQ